MTLNPEWARLLQSAGAWYAAPPRLISDRVERERERTMSSSLNCAKPDLRIGLAALILSAGVLGLNHTVVQTQSGVSYELDGFENGLRVVQPATTDQNKYLWN